MSTTSNITLLQKFNVKEISALEERVVHLGMDEVWYGSFWSEACNILFFFIMFYLFLLSEKVRISILLLGSEAAASLFAVQDSFNKCVPWDDRNTIQANDEYYVIKNIFFFFFLMRKFPLDWQKLHQKQQRTAARQWQQQQTTSRPGAASFSPREERHPATLG